MRILLFVLALAAVAPAQEEERVTGTCEICGGTTYGMRRELVTGNIKYVTIGRITAPRLCQACTVDVQAGRIDPKNPPNLAPRDHEHETAVLESNYKPGIEAPRPEKKRLDEGAGGGFGAFGWVVGIVVVLGFALRYFLK